jgi:hypothetical protein
MISINFRLIAVIFLSLVFSLTAKSQTDDCKPFEFNLPQSFQTVQDAYSMVSGDFNGDGNTDLFTPNNRAQSFSVMLGDGASGFAPPKNFAAESAVGAIATGDLNGDGKPDLAGATIGGNNSRVIVLLNNGDGAFSAPVTTVFPSTSYELSSLGIGDFNGDGKADAAVVTGTNLHFLLGNGQGGFVLNTTLNWKGSRAHLIVGNFNNDGLADVAVTTIEYPWEIGIVFGSGSGSFAVAKSLPLTGQPTGLKIGDFNNDGKQDLIVAAYYPYQNSTPQTYFLEPWISDGAGNFNAAAKVQLPFQNSDVAVGDFDGDGKQDLATNLSYSMIAVVRGRGNAIFQSPLYWTTSHLGHLVSANVNHDGKDDLLVLRGAYPNSLIAVMPGSSEGFTTPRATPYGPTEIDVADLNNDGYKDFVAAYKTDYSSSELVIALNNGSGGLLPDIVLETPRSLRKLKTGDFNGDGKRDVLTGHATNGNQLAVYLGDGTGAVAAPVMTSITGEFRTAAVGDFNADGKDDVFATAAGNGRLYLLLSNGDGRFTVAQTFSTTMQYDVVKAEKGDFNEDGKIDLIVSDGTHVELWLGSSNGQFTRMENAIPDLGDVTIGDFNGDGNLDLAGFAADTIKGVFGNGNGSFGEPFSSPLQSNGTARSLISGDFNLDGSDDLAYAVILRETRNLVIIPGGGASGSWKNPVFYSVGGLDSYVSALIAADFNSDNKLEIGYSTGTSRGIILNARGTNPCVSVSNATVTEGDGANVTANFTVSLSAATDRDVYVSYALEEQTARIGSDVENADGRLKIPAGQTSVRIAVTVKGDLSDEPDETFTVNLSSPTNAALQKAVGVGTIIDNDAEPTLTVSDVVAAEGGFGNPSFTFKVSLSAPSSKTVSFRYATADGTAKSNDYAAVNNTWNIPAGTLSADIYVGISGENIYEPDENFFLNITEPVNVTIGDGQGKGTIVNDDPIPTLNLFSGNIAEGDTGTKSAQITVNLSNPTYLPVTVNLLTGDGTALGGKDFVASDNVVTIPAEAQSSTTNVQILGDTINEPNETLYLNVYNPTNAVLLNTQSQFVIIDDESVSNDFDRDGKSDAVVFRPGNRTWYTLFSSNNSFSAAQYGVETDKPVSGDYNGDGRTNIAVFRPSNGVWYTTIPNRTQSWGLEGDVPVPGDYDNDGRIDVAVFRPSSKIWYIQLSSNNSLMAVQFGLASDKLVPADYDGDGKTDIAVYRPETGVWYGLRSRDNGFFAVQFGSAEDKPVPADYDGDGKADISVYREGVWLVSRSSDAQTTTFQWGAANDKPVPGNYDGDDKTDFAVYRDGTWWIWLSSTNNFTTKQFGLPDDVPIPFVSNN